MKEGFKPSDMVTARDASRRSGVVMDYITRMCREGDVVGEKVNGVWYVSLASLHTHLERVHERKLAYRKQLADERKREYRVAVSAPTVAHEATSSVPEAAFTLNALGTHLRSFRTLLPANRTVRFAFAPLLAVCLVVAYTAFGSTDLARTLRTVVVSQVVALTGAVPEESAYLRVPPQEFARTVSSSQQANVATTFFEGVGNAFGRVYRLIAGLFTEGTEDVEGTPNDTALARTDTVTTAQYTQSGTPQRVGITLEPLASTTVSSHERMVQVNAGMAVMKNFRVAGSAALDGTLSVAGNGTFAGPLVATDATFRSLGVSGTARVGNASVDANVSVGGRLTTGSTATLNGGLTVNGNTTLAGAATTTGSLAALGGLTTNGADIDAGAGRILASNLINSIIAGRNITIDTTDPNNPVIRARAGGGGGGGTTIIQQGGTGEVSSGLVGQISYYAADGTTIVGTSSIRIADGYVYLDGTASTTALRVSTGFFQDALGDCSAEGQTLLYASTTGTFTCGTDAGAGGGVVDISEGGVLILAGATAEDFNANDFTVADAGGGEAAIGIDYASSGITRASQNATITAQWTFYEPLIARYFAATTTATNTFPYVSLQGLALGSDYVTDLTGTGLIIANNTLTVDDTVFFSLAAWYATSTPTIAAYISASSSIPHTPGSAYGDLLVWNGSSWTVAATSTLGIGGASFTGTGIAGMLTAWDSATGLTATSAPTMSYLTATSTTATSTFMGAVSIGTTTGLATLTVASPVPTTTDPELVTNGTFTGDATGWNLGSEVTYGSNQITALCVGTCDTYGPHASTTFSTVAGETYLVTFEVTAVNGIVPSVFFRNTNVGMFLYATGTHTIALRAGTTGTETVTFASWRLGADNTGWSLDNVSIKASTPVTSAFTVTGYNGSTLLSLGGDLVGNTAMGEHAFASNTTGYMNTAYGVHALRSNTTGLINTANGYAALSSNTDGWGNTANGSYALLQNTTGYWNTANGSYALRLNTTGWGNTAYGARTLMVNTTGSSNTAIGHGALWENTTGNGNTAVGRDALNWNTSATSSTAVGQYAAVGTTYYNNQGGVYLGYYAGYAAASSSDYNTLLGYRSGRSVSTGARNVLVGANAGYTGTALTTGSNNILIGYGVGATSSTMSYGLNIGNLIYGTGLTGTGNTLSSGNIGIGTTSPYARLSVAGAVVANSFTATSSTSTFAGITTTGLAVTGSASSTFANGLNLTTGCYAVNGVCLTVGGGSVTGSGIAGMLTAWDSTTGLTATSGPTMGYLTATSTTATSTFAGAVGIGTTSPLSILGMQRTGLSGTNTVGGIDQYLGFTNSVESALLYGDRSYLAFAPTATSTLVGKVLRIEDNSTYGNTVRGFEVQADKGLNTLGENTALSGFARTFGVRGTTRGDAGAVAEPAGVFGETQGTTQGNALRGYSGTITSASLMKLYHDTSAFTGTGLTMDFANTTGSFTGNFLDLKNVGTSLLHIASTGALISSTTATSTFAGAVGIGTTSPWRKLSVTGTVAFDGLATETSGNYVVCINPTTKELYLGASGTTCTPSSAQYKHDIRDMSSALTTLDRLRPVTFYFNDAGDPTEQLGLIAEEVFAIDSRLTQQNASGSPATLKLDNLLALTMKGLQEHTRGFRLATTTGTSSIVSGYTGTAVPALAITGNGALGVGTTAPTARLTVQGVANEPLLALKSASDADMLTVSARGVLGVGAAPSVLASSNLPDASLVVGGALCVDGMGGERCATATRTPGVLYAESASVTSLDLAELYPTKDDTLAAGELLMLDPENPVFVSRYGTTSASTTPTLLGVVSTKPGILLGGFEDTPELMNEHKVSVALSGRVPVWVSDEYGAINVGDRIGVSAKLPGYGARAASTGYTVGIALEAFTPEAHPIDTPSVGSILVFVDPQYHFSSDELFIDHTTGYVGIGTTTPTRALTVDGEVGAQAFVNLSTREAKKDITYLTAEDRTSALTELRGMKLATYHYADEASTSSLRLGLIAEEAPASVLSADGKGVDLYKLNALTLAGVQELSQKVTALENILGISLAELGTTTPTGEGGNGLLAFVLEGLRGLGVSIRDGFASFTALFTDELTVGSEARPAGIQLYDEVTNEPYCVRVRNGALVQTLGECGATPEAPTNGGTDVEGGGTAPEGLTEPPTTEGEGQTPNVETTGGAPENELTQGTVPVEETVPIVQAVSVQEAPVPPTGEETSANQQEQNLNVSTP